MYLGTDLDKINHDELLELYNKTKDFVSFLDNEIETVEVEKKRLRSGLWYCRIAVSCHAW